MSFYPELPEYPILKRNPVLSTPSTTNSADPQPTENGGDTGADGLASAQGELLLPPVTSIVYKVGDYLIGDAEDAKLGGHPDIRY
ncbi:hypothetical protein [Hymenobacter psychrotolerans]|uniref:hypothetical protein n=1 Tax=Hymenobacter psychrotolerans TaxID=344998 RepID=UPI001115040A|nr:hypothetical protein [Hymenobacter psychrotolerans]